MDESLKARLIGATALVIVAVLLIPELLSGRKDRGPAGEGTQSAPGTRTFTIELGPTGGDSGQPSPVRTTAAPVTAPRLPAAPAALPSASAPAGLPSASTATVTVPVVDAGAAVAATVAGPAATASPDATTVPPPPAGGAAATTGGGWSVQVGAFGTADSAARVVRDLGAAGFEAYVAPVTRDGRTLHRVRVGHESDEAAAERLAQRLKARGLPATVVEGD